MSTTTTSQPQPQQTTEKTTRFFNITGSSDFEGYSLEVLKKDENNIYVHIIQSDQENCLFGFSPVSYSFPKEESWDKISDFLSVLETSDNIASVVLTKGEQMFAYHTRKEVTRREQTVVTTSSIPATFVASPAGEVSSVVSLPPAKEEKKPRTRGKAAAVAVTS
jgi:hypothetical protein